MSEEEKTLEEQTETIIDAIENETEDDVREAFEINKEDGPLAALGAPLIRALGDPEPADPNMIQKHLDNFLAALCGETPVDSNVRTSTEYWLKRLADGLGGSTKKIYCHTLVITFTDESTISYLIFNNDPTPFTPTTFIDWVDALYVQTGNVIRIACSGTVVSNSVFYTAILFARRATSPYYRVVARSNAAGNPVYLDFTSKSDFTNYVSSLTDNITPLN